VALSKRELKILYLAAGVIIASLGYIYIAEPLLSRQSSLVNLFKSADLLERKNEIIEKYNGIFSGDKFRKNPNEQQLGVTANIGRLCRETGINEISSLRPLEIINGDHGAEISLQLDITTSLNSLVGFMHKLSSSGLPYQIQKLSISGDEANPSRVRCSIVVSFLWVAKV